MNEPLTSHMCRDGHPIIRHNDSENERCPLCVALDQRDRERRVRETAESESQRHAIRTAELHIERNDLRAQRDEARARVAGLEAQVEAIRKASTELVNLAPLGGDLRVMIMSLSAQGLSEKDEKYTFEYERALKATHDALAALSADPLKVGEAHVEIASLFFAVLDALDTGMPTVIGLPCVCETPQLHSDECVVVRDACIKRDRLSATMKGEG